MIQILFELIRQGGSTSYLSLVEKLRDIKRLRTLSNAYEARHLNDVKLKFCSEERLIKDRAEFLTHLIYDVFKGNCEDPSVFIDDFFSIPLLSKDLSNMSKNLPLALVLLAKCVSVSPCVLITIPENVNLLPLYWEMLIEFDPLFLRIRKARKLRDLFLVELTNVPETGKTWKKEDVEINTNHLTLLRLSEEGVFSVVKKRK